MKKKILTVLKIIREKRKKQRVYGLQYSQSQIISESRSMMIVSVYKKITISDKNARKKVYLPKANSQITGDIYALTYLCLIYL